MAGLRESIQRISPPWLNADTGRRVMYACGLMLDAVVEHTLQAVRARFPAATPDDGLPELGRDRRIVRGFEEGRDSYEVRLRRWLDSWRIAGTAKSVLEQLEGYLEPHDPVLRMVSHSSAWDTVVAGAYSHHLASPANWDFDSLSGGSGWSRIWTVIYADGIWETDDTWNDAGEWDDGGTWDTTATPEQVATSKAIVHTWKGAHAKSMWIMVAFDASDFNPLDPPGDPGLPDGRWGRWAKDTEGHYESARPHDVSFWDGR